jgi:hypothetical protein
VGDPEPALERMAAGKWKAARAALESDIEATEGYGKAQRLRAMTPSQNVRVRKLRSGVLGLYDGRDGEISITRREAGLAQEFGERARHAAADLRANLEIANELARERDAGKRAARMAELGSARVSEVREDVRRMKGAHTLVHEVMHGYGPIAALGTAYGGAAAVVEEVTNEVAARRWMRLRVGVARDVYEGTLSADGFRTGAYNGWIDGARGAIQLIYGVDEERAAAMLEAASDRYKLRRIGSITDANDAIKALAEDISKQARKASKDVGKRAALEQELRAAARARP